MELEQLVLWALNLGLSTGHASTVEELLEELSWQIKELQENGRILLPR